jgi:hypothetical protein
MELLIVASEPATEATDSASHSIELVSGNPCRGTNSAVSSTTEDCLQIHYVLQCEKWGLMDTESDISVIVMKVTRRYGWPLFKMLNDEDYSAHSNFAKFMVGRNHESAEGKLWWAGVEQYGTRSMQNSQSVSTQSMKNDFLGKRSG